MEELTVATGSGCPFMAISWLWYVASVALVFAVGALWYGKLFSKAWAKAVDYTCVCGARLAEGEPCTCKSHSMLPMVMQLVGTALVGLMYFLLVGKGVWLAVTVAIAMAAWMKAGYKFRIAEWKRFLTLAAIDVGYFCVASVIFVLFALL